jgi:DNA-binding response OmpR family regulator
MACILLLEDEPDYRQELAGFLRGRGHTVRETGTLAEFWPVMDEADVALIDVNLPDGEGFQAVSRLRSSNPSAGIILLTARGTLQDKLAGLGGGADHYLVKPFRLLELEAIIQALLRRVSTHWRLDSRTHALSDPEGHSLLLNPLETTLFHLLALNPEQQVEKRELVEAWGYAWLDYDLRKLDLAISRLRQRWLKECGSALPLKTEHRRGYSFSEPLRLP